MDKEVSFEGKKYISAKRASEKYGYNPDYIGQLCRSGGIDAKMVGRSWFVNEEAVAGHREEAGRSPRGRLPKNLLPAKEAGQLVGYSADYVGALCRSGLIDCRRVRDKWFVGEASLRKYKLEAEEKREQAMKERGETLKNMPRNLAPTLPRVETTIAAEATPQAAPVSGVSDVSESLDLFPATPTPKKFLSPYRKNIFAGTMIVAAILFAGIFSNAIFDRQTDPLALTGSAPIFDESEGLKGMAVVPSSQDAEKDSEVKQYMKDSFSDEVVVVPDETGVSGVIRPVFKKENPQDYLFVMVPVKD